MDIFDRLSRNAMTAIALTPKADAVMHRLTLPDTDIGCERAYDAMRLMHTVAYLGDASPRPVTLRDLCEPPRRVAWLARHAYVTLAHASLTDADRVSMAAIVDATDATSQHRRSVYLGHRRASAAALRAARRDPDSQQSRHDRVHAAMHAQAMATRPSD